jgi:FkbM family methyltransferase
MRSLPKLEATLLRRLREVLGADIAAAEERAVRRARDAGLLEPRIWGPPERLHVGAGAHLGNAYLNTESGTISVAEDVLLGHDVALTTAAYDPERLEGSRAAALLPSGQDIAIGRGVQVGARAVVAGPCHIGPYAVLAPGAVVTGDVPAGAVVAGNPARVVRRLGVTGDLPPSVEADTDVGRMRLLLADEVITPALRRDGCWEPEEAAALRTRLRPGMTVVDVGANIGYTALVAAQAVRPGGRVIAVEPHPDNVALLRHNAEANAAGAVEVVAAAAWREPGTVRLAVSAVNAGDHRTEALASERATVEVPAVRVDDVVGDAAVDLIKLDCQGCEHVVLAGAAELIARSRPLILAEFWPIGIRQLGDDPAAVLRGYRRMGYALAVLEEPGLGERPSDAAIIAAIEAREDPVGGFATLVLSPAPDGPADLTAVEFSRSSQNGEDGVIAAILDRIGAPGRWFVEFGAEEGREGNCVALANDGWSGLFMEADPAKFAALQAGWSGAERVRTRQAEVTPDTIEGLLAAAGVPAEPDVLSIDIDSSDYYVWEAITAHRPRLVVIEYNASLPLDRALVQPLDPAARWDGTDHFGASLGAYERLAEAKGYALVHTDSAGVNAFFVRRDLLDGSGLPTGAAVRRHPANYFGSGRGHPRDPEDRPWVDLDAGGDLVRVPR